MRLLLDILSLALLGAGLFFTIAGTVGLFRFPDVFSRLHALTKADSLGLGFTVAALSLRADSVVEAVKLALAWLLVLAASGSVGFLIASESRRRGREPWRKDACRKEPSRKEPWGNDPSSPDPCGRGAEPC